MSEPVSKFEAGFQAAYEAGGFLKAEPGINVLSLCSVMLEMYFGEQMLAKGTGWFWRRQDGVALVTAWHNFSGLHHTLRKPMSPRGGLPDRVRYHFMSIHPRAFQHAEISLFLDDDQTAPRWFVHPVCGSFFDMAFILLDIRGGEIACVNDHVPVLTKAAAPGDDLFAIGYPQGINLVSTFPIWKRGTVASDPDLPVEGHPKFFADLAGRGGLSGAPVYRRQQSPVLARTDTGISAGLETKIELLGLYSGRAADQLPAENRAGESTDLGFVWRSEVVLETLQGGVPDEFPEVGKGEVRHSYVYHAGGDPEI